MASSKPLNRAAFVDRDTSYPLVVKDAPYPSPGPGELVIRNAAIALNAIDYIKQSKPSLVFSDAIYPLVMGYDIAGDVVEVGANVSRFRPGDRVVAAADSEFKRNAEAGFQLYTLVKASFASPIPESMSSETASVIPLGVVTAGCALFGRDQLGLSYPAKAPSQRTERKKIVLVWGGSTSVGLNAIQLAVAAGYTVFTTCSPKNFDLVKSLGASEAFDYRTPNVIDDVVRAIGQRQVAGAVAIGYQSGSRCIDILKHCQGTKMVSLVTYPVPENPDASMVSTLFHFAVGSAGLALKGLQTGVKKNTVLADAKTDGVGQMIFEDFLPDALRGGTFVPAPTFEVVGDKLEDIQAGLDRLKKGVSAKKLVISLSGA